MFELLKLKKGSRENRIKIKILLTATILILYRFGNVIPLSYIDQEALKKGLSQLDNRNGLSQMITMYSGSEKITPFSLGIIPYINASLLVDVLTVAIPSLEKLQNEEGEMGRKQLMFYKKILTVFIASFQTVLIISYLKPYFYDLNSQIIVGLILVCGALFTVWLANLIDKKGIGNGTSLFIGINILTSAITTNSGKLFILTEKTPLEIITFFMLVFLISLSQLAKVNIPIVSARQLAYLQKQRRIRNPNFFTSEPTGLSLKFNQSGIYPIIIATNLLSLFLYLLSTQGIEIKTKFISNIIYYCLIIIATYFSTSAFWDPQKIAENLRKSSVSIVDVTPGKETVLCLESAVRSSSILGGILLCFILIFSEIVKKLINGPLLNQLNISSLIIFVGVCFDLQKSLRSLSSR